eukprot:Hpha_TRINITY_DN16501_c2_g13::TRINITY_DN16501_c2_g13_i1::g.137222::m.137222
MATLSFADVWNGYPVVFDLDAGVHQLQGLFTNLGSLAFNQTAALDDSVAQNGGTFERPITTFYNRFFLLWMFIFRFPDFLVVVDSARRFALQPALLWLWTRVTGRQTGQSEEMQETRDKHSNADQTGQQKQDAEAAAEKASDTEKQTGSTSTCAESNKNSAAYAAADEDEQAEDHFQKPENRLWTIHGRKYDLTDFMDSHPGGSWPLELMRGSDCTVMFEVYHVFVTREHMEKRMAPYEVKASPEAELCEKKNTVSLADPITSPATVCDPLCGDTGDADAGGSAGSTSALKLLPPEDPVFLDVKKMCRAYFGCTELVHGFKYRVPSQSSNVSSSSASYGASSVQQAAVPCSVLGDGDGDEDGTAKEEATSKDTKGCSEEEACCIVSPLGRSCKSRSSSMCDLRQQKTSSTADDDGSNSTSTTAPSQPQTGAWSINNPLSAWTISGTARPHSMRISTLAWSLANAALQFYAVFLMFVKHNPLGAPLFVISSHFLLLIMHDTSHFAFAGNRNNIDYQIGRLAGFMTQINTHTWSIQHGLQHHLSPNLEADVDLYHFVPLCRTSRHFSKWHAPHFVQLLSMAFFLIPSTMCALWITIPTEVLHNWRWQESFESMFDGGVGGAKSAALTHDQRVARRNKFPPRYAECKHLPLLRETIGTRMGIELLLVMVYLISFWLSVGTVRFCMWFSFIQAGNSWLFILFTQISHLREDCHATVGERAKEVVENAKKIKEEALSGESRAPAKNRAMHNWVKMQVEHSADYGIGSTFWHLMSSGIHTQCLHHVLPGISHSHHNGLYPLYVDVCRRHGIDIKYRDSYWGMLRKWVGWMWVLSFKDDASVHGGSETKKER